MKVPLPPGRVKIRLPRRKRVDFIMCWHEAGHAVAARVLGVEIEGVALSGVGDAAASVTTRSKAHEADKSDVVAQISAYEIDGKVALAGYAAQALLEHKEAAAQAGRTLKGSDDPDMQRALSCAAAIALLQAGEPMPDLAPGARLALPESCRESAEANYARLLHETYLLVFKHRSKIERLAKAFFASTHIEPAEIDRMFLGP